MKIISFYEYLSSLDNGWSVFKMCIIPYKSKDNFGGIQGIFFIIQYVIYTEVQTYPIQLNMHSCTVYKYVHASVSAVDNISRIGDLEEMAVTALKAKKNMAQSIILNIVCLKYLLKKLMFFFLFCIFQIS